MLDKKHSMAEATRLLSDALELASYLSNRGIDAFLEEEQLLQLVRLVKTFEEAGFSEAEIEQVGRQAGLETQQRQALWLAYEWQTTYPLHDDQPANQEKLAVLYAMFNQITALGQGVYYLSMQEKNALYWFNQQADLGENRRLYLFKLAARVGLQAPHLVYLRQLSGRRAA